jgi:predicted ATPase
MAQFIPEIQRLLPAIIQNKKQDPQNPKSKIQNPKSIIVQATAERPCLLILDDLQWADQGSLKLLHYLARHCTDMRLMIVGLYRDSGLKGNKFLKDTLDNLKQRLEYTSIALEPLTDKEVKQFLEGIWSQTTPADLIAAIYRRTEGNPFYIEEIAKGLMDEGVVSQRNGQWRFAAVVEAGLPQRIHDAVLRRTNRLGKKTQTLLNQAAILGPTFKFSDLHEMSELSEREVLASLDVVLQRQLINQVPGENILRLGHTEIQEVLYKNLSPLKRRVIHLEAGEALERGHQSELKQGAEALAAALAYHFFQAGKLEKGLTYSIQAAKQAEAVYANQNALFWYTQALDTLDQLATNDTTRQQQFDLLLARERIYSDQGDRPAQTADLAALQSLVQVFDDPAKEAVVHNRRASYSRLTGRFGEAIIEAQAGL